MLMVMTITGTGNVNLTGVVTATTFSGNLPTTDLTGTITNAQLAGSIANDKLVNDSVSYGGIELDLGASDATPAFDLSDATNYPYTSLTGITTEIVGDTTPQLGGNLDLNSKTINGTGNVNLTGVVTATTFSGNLPTTDLTGTITNAQLAGSIENDKLVNDSVSYGGIELDLGASDPTPAFDLTDAINYPTSSLTGTITNAQLAGSIENDKLVNDSVSYGGIELDLGQTDATPAFDLSDATNYPTSSLSGTITNAQLAGSIENDKLVNDSVSYGGIELDLGASDATPAFDLTDAINYPTSSLTGTITNAQLAGSIANDKLVNDSVSYGGVSLDLGQSDATPAFDLTDATNYPTSSLTGTITNAQLAGSIANDKLVNDSVSYGGVSLDLGASDATPAFDLSDATNYPTSSLTGTITNAQLAGSITNSKLVNDSVSFGGIELDLGASDATPAFDLSDATNYPTSSLTGTITNAQLAGSIENDKLVNDSVSYGGIELDLGASDATPAFDLSDATNYPYTSLTGITTEIVGDTTPQLGGNLDVNGNDITGTGNVNLTGIITATSLSITDKLISTGIGISVLNGVSNTATIAGPANLIIDPGVVGDNTGTVRIKGDLYVDGTQTTINSTTVQIADFVVGIATTATTDTLSDGAGLEFGPSNNNFKYFYNSGTNPSLKSSENLNVASGKSYQIDQTEVLNSTTLGNGVVNSSLTSVGTLNSLSVSGVVTAATFSGNLPTTDLTGTITNAQLAGSIANDKLVNDSVSYGGIELDLGQSDATPAFDLSDATNYPTSSLTGTITNAQLAGSIENDKLVNDSVSYGGIELDLGASDATPAFDLTDATNYPTSSLTGTITNAQLAGSIANDKLVNDSVSYGGIELDLGASDATPAFDLTDATNYPTSSLTGTITNAQLAGSIANDKLVNDSVSYGGIELDLGASDATPAFDLSDATNYPTSSLTGTITNAQLAGSIENDKLVNDSVSYGGIELDLGQSDATPAFDLSDATNYPTSSLSGTITNAQLAGSIENDKLVNDSVSYGGIELDLGQTDATPAFNLTDATNYPTSSLTGTITNAQLAGSIENDKLVNDSVSFGGVSLDLGQSDATPAFDLTDATNYPTSSLTGTITNAQLAGSITNDKLVNDSVSFGGVSVDLGASDATPAFDLSDATNYPYTSLTGITTEIVGDTTPQLGGNLDLNSKTITGTGGINVTGIITATSFVGDGSNLTGLTAGQVGALVGITIKEEGSNVGSADSVSSVNFVSSNLTATASGIGATITLTDTPTFTSVGIGTTNPQSKLEVNVGTAISAFNIQGSAGQLFSVTNNLTSGSIFSVNDVSGIPSINVDADGTIQLAPYGATELVGIGTTNPTSKLHVVGDVKVAGVVTATTFSGNLPTTDLTGTITNAQLAGSIENDKLVNDSVSYGGIELDLGQSDATPAFDLI